MPKIVRNKISLPGRQKRRPCTYQPLNISRPVNKGPIKPMYTGDFIIGESEL